MLQQAVQANDGAAASPGCEPAGSPEPRPVRRWLPYPIGSPWGTTERHPVLELPLEPVHGGGQNEGHHPEAIPMRRSRNENDKPLRRRERL